MAKIFLGFSDESIIEGQLFGYPMEKQSLYAEVCLVTSMTGYQEIITDPSYAKQIILFTSPHIGNTGINEEDYQSKTIHAQSIITRNPPTDHSHYKSQYTLHEWLYKNKIFGITNINTRALINHIRKQDTHFISISQDPKIIFSNNKENDPLSKINYSISNQVSCKKIRLINNQDAPIIAIIDYGVKQGIITSILKLGYSVLLCPYDTTLEQIQSYKTVGIVLSNGPGNPEVLFQEIKDTLIPIIDSGLPIMGICMGHQLLAIKSGAKIRYMDQGHRGSNHPVYDLSNNNLYITSQNHGFVVDNTSSLPNDVIVTHQSLLDKTIQGIKIANKNIFSVQLHPEALPGTNDAAVLFAKFKHMIEKSHKVKDMA